MNKATFVIVVSFSDERPNLYTTSFNSSELKKKFDALELEDGAKAELIFVNPNGYFGEVVLLETKIA